MIWGIIGWKIYAATKENDEVNLPNSQSLNLPSEKAEVPDTYQLLLDYPDPFLGKSTSPVKFNTNPNPVKNNTPIPPAIIPKQTNEWPEIKYSGLVKSPKDGKVVGFLSVDGVSHFVKNGDVVGVVSVQNIWRDSVMVYMGKEKKVVRK